MTKFEVQCHKYVLCVVSNLFRLKIAAYERRNDELIFNYTQFDKATVQLYLDVVYKTDSVDHLCILSLLKLAEFLKWEGKNMFSGIVLSSVDSVSIIASNLYVVA